MKAIFLCALVGAIAAGCVASAPPPASTGPSLPPRVDLGLTLGAPYDLSQPEVRAVKAGVRDALRDPSSAVFGDMQAAISDKDVVTVCGYVNARNGFGGMTGMLPYVGILARATGSPSFSPHLAAPEDAEIWAALEVCRQSGVDIG